MGRNNSMYQDRLGADLLERSSVEKDTGVLVDNRLAVNHQCAFVARKANSILGCIKKRMASRPREMIFSIHSAMAMSHLKFCIRFWAPQFKGDKNFLVKVKQRATEMIGAWSFSLMRKG